MQFDSILNLSWALLGTLALLYTVCASRRVVRHSSRRRQLIEAVGVASIIIALFPFISATDDVLRVQQYTSQHHSQESQGGHHNNLLRLFEAADHSLVIPRSHVGVTLTFLAVLVFLPCSRTSRIAPLVAGRSPPPFAGV